MSSEPEIRYLTSDEFKRLRNAFEKSVIDDCPELAFDDVWFYLSMFDVQLMPPEMLRAEKAYVLGLFDPDLNYVQMIDQRLAGETVCAIPDEVWKVLDEPLKQ